MTFLTSRRAVTTSGNSGQSLHALGLLRKRTNLSLRPSD